MLATPIGPRDIAVGEIAWSLMRGALYSAMFLVVALVAGAGAVVVGAAGAARGGAHRLRLRGRGHVRHDVHDAPGQHFDYVTLAIQPMFLFSATFFPLSTYPPSLQWLVQATPLYHGVALERALMLGEVGPGVLWHVLYLAALGGLGLVGTARRLEKLLLS